MKHQSLRFALLLLTLIVLEPLIAQARAPSDIWISHRADGKKGKGTRLEPFDGSRAERLDWLIEGISSNTTIHFGAGVFLTRGIQVKEGWKIRGAGKNLTTIKLEPNSLNGATPGKTRAVIYEYDFQGFFHYLALSDLTIDCNRAQQPAFRGNLYGYSLDAFVLAAKSAEVRNVRAYGTWANPGEGFPCRVYHDGSKNNDDRIEILGCENIAPIGYLTAISVFDQGGGTVAGAIRDCRVIDHPGGAAFGSGGWKDFVVADNYTRNVSSGMVIDSNGYYHVDIFGNHFYNCGSYAIVYNGGCAYEDIRIHDNVFDLSRGTALLTGNAKVTTSIYRNVFIQGDRSIPFLAAGPNTKSIIKNNVVHQRSAPKNRRRNEKSQKKPTADH